MKPAARLLTDANCLWNLAKLLAGDRVSFVADSGQPLVIVLKLPVDPKGNDLARRAALIAALAERFDAAADQMRARVQLEPEVSVPLAPADIVLHVSAIRGETIDEVLRRGQSEYLAWKRRLKAHDQRRRGRSVTRSLPRFLGELLLWSEGRSFSEIAESHPTADGIDESTVKWDVDEALRLLGLRRQPGPRRSVIAL